MKQFICKIQTTLSAPRATAAYAAGASAAVLSAAYISQYGFGLDPCILCYYQRIPYFVVIGLAALAWVAAPCCAKTTRVLLMLCALGFFITTGIAGYHAGVEYKWWQGLQACGNATLPANAGVEELRAWLHSRSIVRCDVPAFSLFGISMAGYNFLISLFLGMHTLTLVRERQRNTCKKNA